MTTIHITKDDAIKAMEAAVEQRGEGFWYESMFGEGNGCQYWAASREDEDDYGQGNAPRQAACLVGLAFHLAWPMLDNLLMDHNDDNVHGVFNLSNTPQSTVEVDYADIHVVVEPDAVEAFQRGQASQDEGEPWGIALSEARKAVVS